MNATAASPTRLRAVILDWAGTVVDFGSRAPARSFIEVFRRHGVAVTTAQARGPMGTAKRRHLELMLEQPAVAEAWRRTHGGAPGPSDVERLYQDFLPIQLACLAEHAALVPGALTALSAFRRRGLSVGTTTGYSTVMMALVAAEAARQGFVPDVTVCADEVPFGRPHPWMCLRAAMAMGVYPMWTLVKVGDTVPDVLEGLHAGMWTVGVAETGNELGLGPEELDGLPDGERRARLEAARMRLGSAGAHYVVDGIGDVPALLDQLDARIARGERPA
jgi:phosphonoacetaldehyde hydrolase